MSDTTEASLVLPRESAGGGVRAEALSLVLGATLTFALFFAVAHFEGAAPTAAEPEIATLRTLAVPPEAPPPRPVETPPVTVAEQPLSGIEVSASDSPVRITVVPPDLSAVIPSDPTAPVAKIEPARLYTDLKPRTDIDTDFGRVFQVDQVDRRPLAVARPKPQIPPFVQGTATSLRVFLIVVIDPRGAVSDIRIMESSGNKRFDTIIVNDVRERWVFSPAELKGRKVRCMIHQNVRVDFKAGSPFELK